jgi:O-antigen/teichoic acid export membrane protein
LHQEFGKGGGPGSSDRPPRGLAARIVRAMSAQMMTQGLRIAQQILLVPFFLRAWGVELYTDWLLINAGVAVASIFDGGLQPYFSGLLQERRVQEDIAGYRRAAGIALFDYLIVILTALAAAGVASLFVDWPAFLGIGTLSNSGAYATLTLLGANALITLPLGMVGSLYRAHGEYDRGVMANAASLAIQIVIPLILLALRQPPPILAAGTLSSSLVAWLAVSADQRVRYGPLPWGLVVPTGAELRTTVTQCLYFTAQPITTWLTIQGPIVILGHLGTPAATVAFATARTLVGVARQLTLQLAYPFGFEMSVQMLRGESDGLRRLLKNAVSIIGIIGGALAGFIMVAGIPIQALWLRGRVNLEPSLIVAFAVPVALTASAQLYQLILVFSNRPRLTAYAVFGYTISGLMFAALLEPGFGATGVAAGLGLGEVMAMALYLPSRTLRMIGIADLPIQRAGLPRTLLALAVSYVIARITAAFIPTGTALGLILFSGTWGAATGLCTFLVLLEPAQRALILKTFRLSAR